MEETTINIIDNIIKAVSILNTTDEYLDSLVNKLSECDSLISDYEHFIENTPFEEVNLEKLYKDMQGNFMKRRIVKNDMNLRDNYRNLTTRLNNSANREFLIQNMKNAKNKLSTKYHNRVLTDKDVETLKTIGKKKVGRPKKVKEGII